MIAGATGLVVRQGNRLHDFGKLGIPEALLCPDAILTSAERVMLQRHTVIGANILSGSASPLLQAGAAIALSHHERWNGSGYPSALSREKIPLYGRICAVADSFDSLISRRSYRMHCSLQQARDIMCKAGATQFDPRLLSLFLNNFPAFEAIWRQYPDTTEVGEYL